MDIIYQNIPNYVDVEIKKLSKGSILVDYNVILSTDFTPDYEKELLTITKKVEETIKNVTSEQSDTECRSKEAFNRKALRQEEIYPPFSSFTGLCFNPNKTSVQEPEFLYNPEKQCQELAGELKEFFYIEYKDGTPHCINSKNLVYGLVGTLGVMLVIIIVALSVFMYKSQRKIQRQKARLDQVYKWHEEDGGPAPGSFQNTGFDIYEEQEDSIHADSIYNNFQPSLDHIDPEKKIQIQRPQVVMTSV